MATGMISQNPEQNASAAGAYRQYADEIEQYGAVDPSVTAQLNTLGDLYAEYKEAKVAELNARAGAHSRVANHARAIADKLDTTSQRFLEQDQENAARIAQSTNEIAP
jgi:uncharacterized membrane protein